MSVCPSIFGSLMTTWHSIQHHFSCSFSLESASLMTTRPRNLPEQFPLKGRGKYFSVFTDYLQLSSRNKYPHTVRRAKSISTPDKGPRNVPMEVADRELILGLRVLHLKAKHHTAKKRKGEIPSSLHTKEKQQDPAANALVFKLLSVQQNSRTSPIH